MPLEYKTKCKPFLRWAGGKRWLLKDLHKYLPENNFNQYHEPFLGGGAVFFYLEPENISFLSDLNEELIETYNIIKHNVEDVILYLNQFNNTKEEYYRLRGTSYVDPVKRAARFIYLNFTSFNGIYRVNRQGDYNVPYGYRKNKHFDYENLKVASKSLQGVNIAVSDFSAVTQNVEPEDLIFIDPPYTVAHNNNGFIEYNQKIFSLEDQYRLAETINEIKEIGAYYILTNAAHFKIREIFDNGDPIFEVFRGSSIGGKEAKRGKYAEYLITNAI